MDVKINELSDSELIILLKSNDQVAFRIIYEKYWAILFVHVYKMLRDRAATMDVLQDIFSSFWLKSGTLNPETKIAGYLYVSARNRVFNLISQNKVKNDYLSSVAHFITEADTKTMDALDEKDLMQALLSEISTLPPKMRLVFELSRHDNLTYKEIAKQLNISEMTVRKQVQYALRILKSRLGHLGISISILIYLR